MSEAFMNHGRAARFALACLVAAMCLFWGAGAFGHDLESLRSLQQKELDAIEAKYSEKARQVAAGLL